MILVEGGEVFLIPAIVDKIKGTNQLLDYENITVARVNGKGNFLIYATMLDCFDISYLILGDLDCFKDEVRKLVYYLNLKELEKPVAAIKAEFSKLETSWSNMYDRIVNIDKNHDAQMLRDVFDAFHNGQIERDDERLLATISFMESRFTDYKKDGNLMKAFVGQEFHDLLTNLRSHNIFIWSKGELENYYTKQSQLLVGSKDIKALQLSYILQEPSSIVENYLQHIDEIKLLCDCILSK